MDYYKEWIPENEEFKNFYLLELNDGFDGLRIILRSEVKEDKEIEIFFTNYLSYRVVDELGFLKSSSGTSIFKLSITETSEYLDWFKEESLNVFKDYNLMHYLIYGSNKVVEIIAGASPLISFDK
jgi:hypothetical protein